MTAATYDALLRDPCPACRPGTPPLDAAAVEALAAALDHGWTAAEARLSKTFRFPDFAHALAFVVRVGAMSEEVDHHPDVELGWGRVRLVVWSHAAGGLTRTDFAWAARAEALAAG
jgi:4a-hydroxytetrahydrobiopterin dehydratase